MPLNPISRFPDFGETTLTAESSSSELDVLIRFALAEDLVPGFGGMLPQLLAGDELPLTDVTTDPVFSDQALRARISARSAGILSGARVLDRVFEIIDPSVKVQWLVNDADAFTGSDVVARLTGTAGSILKGERTALNFLGHLSGIASMTRRFADLLADTPTRILDTRKTLPGMRLLEKQAVVHGGGTNHRMGLHDMVLIKDNHIDSAGSITAAVEKVRALHGSRFRIEVETRDLEEVREASGLGIDRIMLDNMSKRTMRAALDIIGGRAETEASGNMTLERVRRLRRLGLDFISAGCITSCAGHADFSMTVDGPAAEGR